MKIQPIMSLSSPVAKLNHTKKTTTGQTPNFKAVTLVICKEVENGVRGEAKARFLRVMSGFEKFLSKSKENGNVYVCLPTPGALIQTKYGKELANLQLSRYAGKVDFFYNIESTEKEILEALKRTFDYLLGKPESSPLPLGLPPIESDPISDNVIYDLTHYP